MKIKIKFKDQEWASLFVKNMNTLPCDVNIFDGKMAFDAKSILAVLNLDFRKEFLVECITDKKEIYEKFRELLGLFEV